MDSLLGTVKPLVGALLMPLPVFLVLTLLGLALLAAGRRLVLVTSAGLHPRLTGIRWVAIRIDARTSEFP